MTIISIILIAVLIAVDQITKLLVINKIEIGKIISVVKFGDKEIFSFTHVRNSGAAWSSFSDKTTIVTIVTIIIIILFLALMFVKPVQKKMLGRSINLFETICFSLIISGGFGNIIDRVRLKEVVDFIKIDLFKFPIFNFADICVVIGCIMFFVDVCIMDVIDAKKKKLKAAENTDE